MTLFYIGVALLVILTLLFVTWPLITQYRHREQDILAGDSIRQSTNVALYHDHLADIQASLTAGSITQEQFDALNAELERNLLEDSAFGRQSPLAGETGAGVASSENRSKPRLFFGVLLLIVLLAAALLYGRLGAYSSWQVKQALDERYALEREFMEADVSQQAQLQAKIITANQLLISRLMADIANHPDNLQTRALLARTAGGMGNYPVAIEQFTAIHNLESEGVASIRAELAQALFLQSSNRVSPEAQSLVDDVLAEEPNNIIGLSLSGIGAFQSGNYAQAIGFWERMVAIEGPNTPNSIALQQGINTARQRMVAAGQGEVTPDDTSDIALDTAKDKAKQDAVQSVAVTDGPQIPVTVSLAGNVTAAPEATVFIYARAWQGMKVPLSIARMQVKDLPVTLLLNNSMSMAPSMNLSTAETFELVARISPSDSPTPQAGDWQVTLGPVTAVTVDDISTAHTLIISAQLPPQ